MTSELSKSHIGRQVVPNAPSGAKREQETLLVIIITYIILYLVDPWGTCWSRVFALHLAPNGIHPEFEPRIIAR